MPVSPTYPGVYMEEIPSGVRTIVGVATSITAFVGRTRRGPANDPTVINSYSDFERTFGGLWKDSTLGFAVRDFFLNGGQRAIIVRVISQNMLDADAMDKILDPAAAAAAATSVIDAATGSAGENIPAVKADAKAAADDKDFNATEKAAAAAAFARIDAIDKADVAAFKAAVPAQFAGENTPDKLAQAAIDKVKQTLALPSKVEVDTEADDDKLTLWAMSPGNWGDQLYVYVDHDNLPDDNDLPSSLKAYGTSQADLFNLSVYDRATEQVEVFRNLTVIEGPRQIDQVLEDESQLLRVNALPGKRPKPTPADDAGTLRGSPFSKTNLEKFTKKLGSGSDGGTITANDVTEGEGLEQNKRGLYALKKAPLFNLLCIPPFETKSADEDANVDSFKQVLQSATAFCEQRRAMLLIDPPASWKASSNAVDGVADYPGVRSKNSAIFFPRLKQANPLKNGIVETFVPSGAMAGLFARTDVERGVWKAPAGLDATLRGVLDLSVNMTDEENGELNPLGVNCLRTFTVGGRVSWGSRTLRGADQLADEWKYIPVRRTALYIEESLYQGLQWVVFEPNDEPLWASIRLNVGAFMQDLFRKGAFQGRSPREAYFVKCDKDTTTQTDISLGIVHILVGFAPLKPAEFVIIQLQQMAGQIET